MNQDELELCIKSMRQRPLPHGLKDRVLAHAARQKRATFRPSQWLAAAIAAVWLLIGVLYITTPGGPNSGFTQAALAKAGPQIETGRVVSAGSLLTATIATYTRTLR